MADFFEWMKPLVEDYPGWAPLSQCVVFKYTHVGAKPGRPGEWFLLKASMPPATPLCGSIGFIRITKRILTYLSSRIVL